jgi:hypothetical protein
LAVAPIAAHQAGRWWTGWALALGVAAISAVLGAALFVGKAHRP